MSDWALLTLVGGTHVLALVDTKESIQEATIHCREVYSYQVGIGQTPQGPSIMKVCLPFAGALDDGFPLLVPRDRVLGWTWFAEMPDATRRSFETHVRNAKKTALAMRADESRLTIANGIGVR